MAPTPEPPVPQPADQAGTSKEAEPKGRLFSDLYVEKGPPNAESERARERLCARFLELAQYKLHEIARAIHVRKGIKNPHGRSLRVHYFFDQFFRDAALVDVLDAVTLIGMVLGPPRSFRHTEWVELVRILSSGRRTSATASTT